MIKAYLMDNFMISADVIEYVCHAESQIVAQVAQAEHIAEYNQYKVLQAMQANRLSDIHFAATTGYGYNDMGRDVLEDIYAQIFGAESGLVRPTIVSGTHALTVALAGNLRPGDEIMSPVGKPYDTLEGVIGIKPARGALSEYGITYKQVDLLNGSNIDYAGIEKSLNKSTRLVTIQRSRGYDMRPSLTVKQIGELIDFIKQIRGDIICMVDNCYGEFVDVVEPTDVGADLAVGSLIKNPGGGLAPVGGYIVGREEYVENAAYRLTAPGLGKEVGPSLGLNAPLLQGLFYAPQVVAGSVKGAVLAAKVFENIGLKVSPGSTEKRCDIVQAVCLGSEERIIAFCEGIQAAAPVDSFAMPEPNDMPGYESKIIMAAGAFVQGSSIELSADGPIREPYAVFMQGGLNYHHIKIGIMIALQNMINKELIAL